MSKQQTAATTIDKDDLIVITGAGGFIAGALTRYFHDQGFTNIRAVDKKPLYEWYQRLPGVQSLCLDAHFLVSQDSATAFHLAAQHRKSSGYRIGYRYHGTGQ